MNYCTASDIKVFAGFNRDFSDTAPITKPTLTELNVIIADTTNEIDLQLSSIGISAQPTNSLILSQLKKICIYGVAGKIGIIPNAGNTTNPETSRTNYYLSQYEKLLKEIVDSPEKYGGLSGEDDYCQVSSNVLDGTNTESEIKDNFMDRDFKP